MFSVSSFSPLSRRPGRQSQRQVTSLCVTLYFREGAMNYAFTVKLFAALAASFLIPLSSFLFPVPCLIFPAQPVYINR
jgi:hypothetical protein